MTVSSEKNNKENSPEYVTGESLLVADWGRVRVEISSDGMAVDLVEVQGDPSLCPTLTQGDVTALLTKAKISGGILTEAVAELVDSLVLDPNWSGSLIIAEGTPPTVPGGADYTLFKEAKEVVAGGSSIVVDGEAFDFQSLHDYLTGRRKPADMPSVLTKMVRPGEVVVQKKTPADGREGHDVFGSTLAPPSFMEVIAGDHIELAGGGKRFVASCLGYVVLVERKLSILSPIVVAEDQMTAWYVQFQQAAAAKSPLAMDMTVLLKDAGLLRETEGERVEELCVQLARNQEPGWFVAAKGMAAVPGENGALIFQDTDPPCPMRDDGTIDYRILNLVNTVDSDFHFATLSPPTEGTAGFTLWGEDISAQPGQLLRVDARANVRVEERDNGELWYYSETEGVVQYRNGKLEIEPLYQVKGNVDFSTGNIDVDCCLSVVGNVCSDFTVKSTKDVVISGILEPGSKMVVQGNLQVKGGIIGEKTEVVVMGNLQAEYLQDARIVVKGETRINQYVFSAVMRSVGAIVVGPGTGDRGGSIVGGTVCSSSRVEAKTTGSPSNVLTTIVVEPAPHKLAVLKKLKDELRSSEASIAKIMRTLNLQAIEPDLVKQLLQEATPDKRKLYVKILGQLNGLVKHQQTILADKNKLRDRLWRDVDKMFIQINKSFYSNTKVRIAKKEIVNRHDRGNMRITHDRRKLCLDHGGGDSSF